MKKYVLISAVGLFTTLAVTATVLGDKKPAKKTVATGCCKKMDAARCKKMEKKDCAKMERTHCFDMAMKTKTQ
ncbi:MAG: hypothetical protein JWP88_2125 [Flaviaesturariibacter sp.]|nr:hypothetical protein [Flaviaesturariibacter sp.]